MAKYRDVSPLECSYLASDSETQSYFVNQFIVEGKGSIKLIDLQRAVRKAAEINPGIRLKLKGYWGKRYWSDDGIFPHVESYHSNWGGLTQKDAGFLGRKIDCRNGPCAEVILLQSTRPKIIFRVHHAICDGAGTLHWIEEVFKALRDEQLEGSDGRSYEWEIAQEYSVAKPSIEIHPWAPVKNQRLDNALFEFNWQHFQIPGEATKITPKIIKILANLAWNHQPNGYVCFRIPSDLRRLVEDGNTHMGNLTGVIDIVVKPHHEVDDIAKIIISEKRKNKDLSVFPKNLWLANWLPKFMFSPSANYFKKQYKAGYCNLTGIISQLGKVKLESLSYPDFRATGLFAIPIPLEGVSASCGIIPNDTGIEICLSIPKSLINEVELAEIVEYIKKELGSEIVTEEKTNKNLYYLKS